MAVNAFSKWLMPDIWYAQDSGSTPGKRIRNGRSVWRFKPDTGNVGGRAGDDGIQTVFDIPNTYFAGASSGSGIGINLLWTQVAGITGNVVWNLSFESHTQGDNIDTDSFNTAQVATATVASVVGKTVSTLFSLTRAQADAVLCSEICRIKLTRNDDDAADTHAGSVDFVGAKVVDVDTNA